MDPADLRALQAPFKQRYRDAPETALVTLRACGELDDQAIACRVATGRAVAVAGLHPATGGDGSLACSGDMLLEALCACAGVTLRAVATALGFAVSGQVVAEGDLDFRGTLGVDREVAVGFRAIRLRFELRGELAPEQQRKLLALTERSCVVLQSLRAGVPLSSALDVVP